MADGKNPKLTSAKTHIGSFWAAPTVVSAATSSENNSSMLWFLHNVGSELPDFL